MPLKTITAAPVPRAPTRRALAKQRTREKILIAAKELFTAKGYEGATIRDIAAAAGMSTGAVFASFADKSELFQEILAQDRETIYAAMRDAAKGASIAEDVLALFAVGYKFHMDDLPLMQAAISASWTPVLGQELRTLLRRKSVVNLVEELLKNAVSRGELTQNANISLLALMLWDSYLGNFANAAFEGWGVERLKARLAEQIDVVLAGARTR